MSEQSQALPEHCECPVVGSFGERCQLPANHNSPHRREDENGALTWEPAYVGDMRRELKDGSWYWRALLADVLGDLGPEITSPAIDAAREALPRDLEVTRS